MLILSIHEQETILLSAGFHTLPPIRQRTKTQAVCGARYRPMLIRLSAITPSPTHLRIHWIP